MEAIEQRLVAHYAEFFRRAATRGTPGDRERRLLTARAFERHLSQDLTETYERRALAPLTRPSEDAPTEPSPDQLARADELRAEHPGCDVFVDPLYAGDVSLEVWGPGEDGRRGRLYEEVIDRRGETL